MKKRLRKMLAGILAAGMVLGLMAGSAVQAEETEYAPLTLGGSVGEINGYQQNIVDLVQAEHPEIEFDYVPTETAMREQVLKTAISAGDPPAVGFYWGTRVNSFYDNGMCLDLRDYLTEEEINSVSPAMLEPCIGPNGEVFAIPITTVYHTVFYNKDMMEEYGFEIPKTWDDMTAIFARLKEDDIFGFATNSASMQDCLYGITYGELESKVGPGTSWKVANGDESVLPGTPAGDVIKECIQQVKDWYDAGYWYPGDGGINCTADDANAAFAQGRCIFIFNFSGAYQTHMESCDFEVGEFMKPTSAEGIQTHENIEPDVYFIPSNCTEAQINTAVAFMKAALSPEGQQGVIDFAKRPPSVMTYEYENVPELLQQQINNLKSDACIAGINPTRTSSEMQTFIKQQVFAAPCSGVMTIDETLEEMERIRLEAVEARG